jgi:hypothetical protein
MAECDDPASRVAPRIESDLNINRGHHLRLKVELLGIEPAAKTSLNCGNAEFYYAKRREMTCGYADSVDGINSTRQLLSVPLTMLSPTTPHTACRA